MPAMLLSAVAATSRQLAVLDDAANSRLYHKTHMRPKSKAEPQQQKPVQFLYPLTPLTQARKKHDAKRTSGVRWNRHSLGIFSCDKLLLGKMQSLTHTHQVSHSAARPFANSKQRFTQPQSSVLWRCGVEQQHRARVGRKANSTPQQQSSAAAVQKSVADMTIDDLDTNYCDDFVCTSSPAVEQTVRSLVRGPPAALCDGCALGQASLDLST